MCVFLAFIQLLIEDPLTTVVLPVGVYLLWALFHFERLHASSDANAARRED